MRRVFLVAFVPLLCAVFQLILFPGEERGPVCIALNILGGPRSTAEERRKKVVPKSAPKTVSQRLEGASLADDRHKENNQAEMAKKFLYTGWFPLWASSFFVII